MTTGQTIATLVAVAAILLGIIVGSMRLVGQVAERFGEDPHYWQPRMLPFTVFGPVVLWLILSRRGGPRGMA